MTPDPGTLSEADVETGARALFHTFLGDGLPWDLVADSLRDAARAALAAVPARDDLAAKVEALAARLDHIAGKDAKTQRGKGHLDGLREAAADLRALLADPGPDQEQP